MTLLSPDRWFSRISRIGIDDDLLRCGLNSVLLDIDNTVRSRATNDIPSDVAQWIARAGEAGVKICLLSNNWHGNVYDFADGIGLPIIAKAMKPLPFGYMRAMRQLGSSRSESVAIGDQLLTDVLGAHLAGMRAYMVAPLSEVDSKRTLFVRRIESALMGEHEDMQDSQARARTRARAR